MKKPLHITIPITKVDEEQRMVYGYATVEEIDAHGEIITYEASKKAFSNWIGNIREMHQDIAVGKAIDIEFDDDAKGVWIGARISESTDGENAWIKVKEGVLAGFSIGGRVNDSELRTMSVDGKKKAVPVITDYVLGETSLVDNPAVASAIFQIVKSVDGHLEETEKLTKGLGRPVHWWEKQFQYSGNQKIMKASVMTYNENSMGDQREQIAKSLWEGQMLVDLAMCLSDYIYWKAWEGEDVEALKTSLEAIQQAAAKEVLEPAEFPQIEVEIENAMRALNIKKQEELVTMSKDLQERKKSVIGQEDRDADGNVVTTAEENTPAVAPANPAVPEAEAPVEEQAPVEEDANEEVETPAAEDEETEEPEVESGKGKGKKSAPVEFEKSTESNDDLAKMISAAVGDAVAKAVGPLKEQIDGLKKQAAPSKVKSTFAVQKGEDVMGDQPQDSSEQGKLKQEFDTTNARAEELAKDANAGTPQERMQVAMKLRKLARQMDPESVAKAAAIKATFNRGQ